MLTDKPALTKREQEILKLMIEGKNNTAIAKELEISFNTVKAHCKSIFEKLEVDNRTSASIKALKDGIVWI